MAFRGFVAQAWWAGPGIVLRARRPLREWTVADVAAFVARMDVHKADEDDVLDNVVGLGVDGKN